LHGADFKLTMASSEWSNTQQISSVTIKCPASGDPVPSELVVTVSTAPKWAAEVDDLEKWADDFIVKGLNDSTKERTVTISGLNRAPPKDAQYTLELDGVGISRLVHEGSVPSQHGRTTAHFYLGNASFCAGGAESNCD